MRLEQFQSQSKQHIQINSQASLRISVFSGNVEESISTIYVDLEPAPKSDQLPQTAYPINRHMRNLAPMDF